MKKRFCFSGALLVAILLSAGKVSAQDITSWQLSERTAKAMISFYKDCKGDCFQSKVFADSTTESIIRSAYPDAVSFEFVAARYRLADVDRYASRLAVNAKTGSGAVAGYSTQIFKVITADYKILYFDFLRICPPPAGCGSEGEDRP